MSSSIEKLAGMHRIFSALALLCAPFFVANLTFDLKTHKTTANKTKKKEERYRRRFIVLPLSSSVSPNPSKKPQLSP
jgi:hypothetical protein